MPPSMNDRNQPSNPLPVLSLSAFNLSTKGSSSSSSSEEPDYNLSAEPEQLDIHPTKPFARRNAIAVASLGGSPPVSSFAFLNESLCFPLTTTATITGRKYPTESSLLSSRFPSPSTFNSTELKDQVCQHEDASSLFQRCATKPPINTDIMFNNNNNITLILTNNTTPRTVTEFRTGGSGGGGGAVKTERAKRTRLQRQRQHGALIAGGGGVGGQVGGYCYYHPYHSSLMVVRSSHKQQQHQQQQVKGAGNLNGND